MASFIANAIGLSSAASEAAIPPVVPSLYFPDVTHGTSTCHAYQKDAEVSNEGNKPVVPSLFLAEKGLFETTVEDCCYRYVPAIWQSCVLESPGGNIDPTYQWSYDQSKQACVKDCPSWVDEGCGGTLSSGAGVVSILHRYLYDGFDLIHILCSFFHPLCCRPSTIP